MQTRILTEKILYIAMLFTPLASCMTPNQTAKSTITYKTDLQQANVSPPQGWDGTMTRACPCPTASSGRPPFVACNVLANTVTTDELVVHDSACFESPVQFCSSVSGLPTAFLEGRWLVCASPNTGCTTLGVFRTRAFDCTGTVIDLLFNKTTDDPADAFTLLKTIRECDVLRLTEIDLNGTCPIVRVVETQAATGMTGGCGDVFVVPVFNVSGLTDIYADLGASVSLLNFGPPAAVAPTAPVGACPCWTKFICTGSFNECVNFNLSTGLLITDRNFDSSTGLYELVFNNFTKDQIDALCKLLAIQTGDLIRLSEFNSNCQSYIDLRVTSKICQPIGSFTAVRFNAIAGDLVGSLTGADCLCLDIFGPIPPVKNCWLLTLENDEINATSTPPFPTGVVLAPGALGVNADAPPTYSGTLAFAFNESAFGNFDVSEVFNALRAGNCVRLFDPSNGFSGSFGTYRITAIVFDGAADAYVMNVVLEDSSSPTAIIPSFGCLQTYGPCCPVF